jgi:hypothetical protein
LEKSGGCVNGELISVEKNIILPTPAGPEPVVRVDIGDATRLWVFLIISTELQALIEAIISIPPIF